MLVWINSEPNTFNTFVANRIAEIQAVTNTKDWYHIASAHNPADVLSRGLSSRLLPNNNLWWYGSDWLAEEQNR